MSDDRRTEGGIIVPTDPTLAKYGLSVQDWLDRLAEQGGVCAICKRVPLSGRTVIDHYHVKGWKTLPPYVRKKYVRGITCVTDNHFILTRYGTPEKFRNAADYLEAFERRLNEFLAGQAGEDG